MASIAEIKLEKNAAVKKAEEVLFQVIDRENNTSGAEQAKWAKARLELEDLINKLNAQAFERALDEAQPAFDALRRVSGELESAAGRMRSATEFINALNDLLGAANTALDTLKKP